MIGKVIVPTYNIALIMLTMKTAIDTKKKRDALIPSAFVLIFGADNLILRGKIDEALPLFAGAHLLNGSYFTIDNGGFHKTDLLTIVPVGLVSGNIFYRNRDYMKDHPEFVVYLAILSFMAWRSLGYLFNSHASGFRKFFAITGASLFYATDVMVGLSRIKNIKTHIWTIYPPALASLAIFNRV